MKNPPTSDPPPTTSSDKMSNGKSATAQDVDYEVQLGLHPARRPTNIERDVNSLGQKKRVSSILRSPDFKEELETVVTDLLRSDKGGGRVIAQAIANVFSPSGRSGHHGFGSVSPINDLTGADMSLYSKGEKLMRCKLAALYRIVDLYGWTQSIFNHISVRVSQEQEHFLINPFGLLYHEVSASKLLKVNMQGEVIDSGSTTLGFNLAGYTLHSAIHAARPDLHCVIHVHTSDAVAVSCMEGGLLPISQEALIVGDVSIHPYHGILVDNSEKKLIQKHLGPNNKVMILRNHGLVACGETVEEAFHYLYHTMVACSIQVKAMSCAKHGKLITLDRSALKHRTESVARQSVQVGAECGVQWRVGEMMFEALIRMLDDMGYRSGYSYRNPVVMKQKSRVKSNVELPATAVGHTAILPEDLEEACSSLKHTERSSQWVNSNQYTRVLEPTEEEPGSGTSSQNGDASPRVRAKWKRSEEVGSAKSKAVRISNPNQFVPTNTDPREVLETRRSIRGQGRWEYNRPGPQSQLLHSVSPDKSSSNVTTSSKAIIEKGNEVIMVSPSGPPNPFNEMSADGLKKYEEEVAKTKQQESSGTKEESADPSSKPSEEAGAENLSVQAKELDQIAEQRGDRSLDDKTKLEAGDVVVSVNDQSSAASPAKNQSTDENQPEVVSPAKNQPANAPPTTSQSAAGMSSKGQPAQGSPKNQSSSNNRPKQQSEVISPKKKTSSSGDDMKMNKSGVVTDEDTPKKQEKTVGSPDVGGKDGKKKKKRPLSFLKKKK